MFLQVGLVHWLIGTHPEPSMCLAENKRLLSFLVDLMNEWVKLVNLTYPQFFHL